MNISIFTPTHNNQYLEDLYNTIKDQVFYEWVIVPNNNCVVPDIIQKDSRVRIYPIECTQENHSFVGFLKKFAASKCTGDILLEVDHDDLLMPNAIEELTKAANDPINKDAGFFYSDSANFRNLFENTEKYGADFGWKYSTVKLENGKILDFHKSMPEYPIGLTEIFYQPNHLRAWRKNIYDKTGGHSVDMRVLDDQDLICRTYKITRFCYIPKVLYLYRITGENSFLKYNSEIQNNVKRIANIYIEDVALAWAKRNNLFCVDFGGNFNKKEGYSTLDIRTSENVDIVADANQRLPFDDNSVGVIRAYDFMEHIPDKIHLINEFYRVLAHGGVLISETPSTDGRGAFQDPTHVAFYNEHSFWYYTNKNLQMYVPEIKARFLTNQLYTYEKRPQIPYVRAVLTAIKGDDLPSLYGWPREDFN